MKTMQHNKTVWWKFWIAVFRALHVPQLTKWLNSKLTKKRCETCKSWIKSFVSSVGEIIDEDSPSRSDYDETIEYGKCKEAVFYNDSSADDEMDIDECTAKGIKMFVEDGEGYFAALYTHKDHCCKCWKRKKD